MWILSWRSSCWNVDPCVLVWMTLRPTTVGGWLGATGAMRMHFSTNKPVPLHQACWHAGALHHDPVACDLLSLGIKSYFCCHQKLRMSTAAGYLCSICRHPQMFLRQILLHDSLILILTKASINTYLFYVWICLLDSGEKMLMKLLAVGCGCPLCINMIRCPWTTY
jgi:hypothetical protein